MAVADLLFCDRMTTATEDGKTVGSRVKRTTWWSAAYACRPPVSLLRRKKLQTYASIRVCVVCVRFRETFYRSIGKRPVLGPCTFKRTYASGTCHIHIYVYIHTNKRTCGRQTFVCRGFVLTAVPARRSCVMMVDARRRRRRRATASETSTIAAAAAIPSAAARARPSGRPAAPPSGTGRGSSAEAGDRFSSFWRGRSRKTQPKGLRRNFPRHNKTCLSLLFRLKPFFFFWKPKTRHSSLRKIRVPTFRREPFVRNSPVVLATVCIFNPLISSKFRYLCF